MSRQNYLARQYDSGAGLVRQSSAWYVEEVALVTDGSALMTEILEPLAFVPDRDALLRCLGYRGPAAAARSLPEAVASEVARGQQYLQPKGIYSTYRMDQFSPQCLTIGGVAIHGSVGKFLARAEQIVVFVVTVGREISERSRAAAHVGNMVAAWALDALGSWAVEATADALSQRLQQRIGAVDTVSLRYSPGYCGMQLAEQRALFRLVDAQAIGVSLEESMLMQPLKSISGLLGIGVAGAFGNEASPCERCKDPNCTMRR